MKHVCVVLIVMALAAFAAGPALAKGGQHSGGHAHHSSGHAHHSSSHAHKTNAGHSSHGAKAAKAGKTMKSQAKHHQQAKTANAMHHTAKTAAVKHSGTNAKNTSATPGATPATTLSVSAHRGTHATTVSHRRGYNHRGYGRRGYNRNRRSYARNGRPSFAVGPDQLVGANSGPQTVAPWATRIRAGSGRQQMLGGLQFQVTNNSNRGLFSAPPSVSPTGTLSFTPAAGQAGTATVTLVLRSGSTSSAPRTFHITVRPA